MSDNMKNDPMLDMFIFETLQLIEQLEDVMLESEKSKSFSSSSVNEIFRIMHTIKGSSAMMLYNNISYIAHSMEDLFFFICEEKPGDVDSSRLTDLILAGADFIKTETAKIQDCGESDADASALIEDIRIFLSHLKDVNPSEELYSNDPKASSLQEREYCVSNRHLKGSCYRVVIRFEEGCEMENIRAFTIIQGLRGVADEILYIPEDIMDNDSTVETIRKEGFKILFKSELKLDEARGFFENAPFVREFELGEIQEDDFDKLEGRKQIVLEDIASEADLDRPDGMEKQIRSTQQSIISVNISKLDNLMDLMGELVISESMVTHNPDLKGLELDNFHKASRQLKKIIGELQDVVMSIRMVPLSTTFHKMNRIVRDMCKKLDREVNLEIIGEETEVDKNIIDHISDPLMHIIRNAVDHGIEPAGERMEKGKTEQGRITLEAKNAGGDVLIFIRDDGRGLDRERILKKARDNGMLYKTEEEMSDREIYNMIFLPGFSTKDTVTEYSGRGVGMDVVSKSIEAVGGSIQIDSIQDEGTTIILKIPLTLAIIDGMNISVGNSGYTIPIVSIKESFRPKEDDVFKDPEGSEMIMIRGQCYPIIRLHELYSVKTNITNISDGILIMVEGENNSACVFADELLGQQQVVVKSLPNYIKSTKKVKGLAGCTLLGDGSISLIIDTNGLINA